MVYRKDFARTVRIVLNPADTSRLETGPSGAPREETASSRPHEAATWRLADPCYREIFHTGYDAIFVTSMEGFIEEANPRAARFAHRPAADLIGRPVEDVLMGMDVNLLLSLREALENGRFVLVQGYGKPVGALPFPSEIAICLLDGPIRKLSFFARDITQRRNTEDLLKGLDTAMQHAASGFVIANLNGRLEYANAAVRRLWGFDGDDPLVGRPLGDLAANPSDPQKLFDEVLERGESQESDWHARRMNGSLFVAHAIAACNRDSEGNVTGVVMSLNDITDALKAQEAMKQAAREHAMLASLAAASHHLAQPATVLLGNLSVMQRQAGLSPDMLDMLESCSSAAEQLAEVLRKFTAVNEFKTQPYIGSDDADSPYNRLLEI